VGLGSKAIISVHGHVAMLIMPFCGQLIFLETFVHLAFAVY